MKHKTAMYPFTVHAYDFKPGDWVKLVLTDITATVYVGKVLHVLPKANKVVVKWPHRIRQEDPDMLIRLNQEESIAVAASTRLRSSSSRKAKNLVRVAQGLRAKGFSDVASFLKMKMAFSQRIEPSWIKGAVELAWPKRTASYSEEADLIKAFYRLSFNSEEYSEDFEDPSLYDDAEDLLYEDLMFGEDELGFDGEINSLLSDLEMPVASTRVSYRPWGDGGELDPEGVSSEEEDLLYEDALADFDDIDSEDIEDPELEEIFQDIEEDFGPSIPEMS